MEDERKDKRKDEGIPTIVIIILVLVAAAVIAAAGGYIFMSGNGDDTSTNGGSDDTDGVNDGSNDGSTDDTTDDTTDGEEDGTTNGETDHYVGTGEESYSGSWEGEGPQGNDYEGTWEFTVNWDTGDVTGSFDGDAAGDINGSVSEGELSAEGEAGFGLVEWSGSFSSDGSEISGDWKVEESGITAYSGTWSGQKD